MRGQMFQNQLDTDHLLISKLNNSHPYVLFAQEYFLNELEQISHPPSCEIQHQSPSTSRSHTSKYQNKQNG